jgi:outer membrane protein assembly factor BamB
LARTGTNPNETILNPGNVNTTSFGLLFTMPIVGRVYGQPLVVSGLTIQGAAHNVVYVATEQSMVYAFDADTGTQLWSRTLETPVTLGTGAVFNPGCADMGSGAATYPVGVTATPVIDVGAGLIYVVNRTTGMHMLHALSLTTGDDGPAATVVGPAAGFDSDMQLNRPGLLLLDGVVYIAFGSNCDAGTYKGWIFGHDATTLALKISYTTEPSGSQGAIWQGGVGLSSDGTNVWFAVGNGTQGTGGNVGFSVVEATPSATALTNTAVAEIPETGDNDLSVGAVLTGDYVLSGGKDGNVLLLNQADDTLVQAVSVGGEVHNVATWNAGAAGQFVYAWGAGASLMSWTITGGMLTNQTENSEQQPGHPGGIITVSSDGTTASSGIVWANIPTSGDAWHATAPGALYAFNASDVSKPSLWNSTLEGGDFGTFAKFSPPTVANGKVYVATFSNTVNVYGLK